MFKTDLAYEIWDGKYRYGNETPLETWQRVARTLAFVEKRADREEWYKKFLSVIVRFNTENEAIGLKFTTGGRVTANAGTEFKGATLLNCYINGPVKNAKISYRRSTEDNEVSYPVNYTTDESPDDLVNIFLTIMEQAKTLASEGGYGINFDFIRPRGSLIKGTGIKHPGVVSYMNIWDSVADCIVKGDNDGYYDKIKNHLEENGFDIEKAKKAVKKATRKGAMMGTLSSSHPDIEEFIRAKQKSGVLTKFNISIAIDDVLMEAVIKDDFYELHFNGVIYKKVKARDLYNLIMECTYNRAEPGCLFVDNMAKNNPVSYLGSTTCTNPCILEGTLVPTDKGLVPVEKIRVKSKIQTTLGFGEVEEIEVHKNEALYRVSFSDGFHQDVTKGHIFHTMENIQNRSDITRKAWTNSKRLQDLKVGDYVRKAWYEKMPENKKELTRDIGLLIGLYLGDGCFSNNQGFNIACNSLEDNNYIEALYRRLEGDCRIDKSSGNGVRYYLTGKNKFLNDIFKKIGIKGKDIDLVKILDTNEEFIYGLIDGLISSDGNVNLKARYPQIRFKNTSIGIHNLVKHLFLFVKADYKLYKGAKAGEVRKIEGRNVVREQDIFEGIIDNDSILFMYKAIGYFSHPEKNKKLIEIIKTKQLNGVKWKAQIKSIKKIGRGTVYDLFEPISDDWNHEGYVSRGCGEVPGLGSITTVCLLGSFNVTQYISIVKSAPVFDWKSYERDIAVATRMLDNVNSIATNPIPSYQWATENMRQIGMGINGLGSALMMMMMPYGSAESIEFTKKLVQKKENITWQTSALLATEKGVFTAYVKEKFENTAFFKSNRISKKTKDMLREHGARNAKTTTNPPLGNTSQICNQVTNGIEPAFLLEFDRKKIVDEWPEGLTMDNVKSMLSHKVEHDFEIWEGSYEGKRFYYEPHNRGLCEVLTVRDFGYQWLLDNFPDKDHSGYALSTRDLVIEDHLKVQEIVQYYCNQSVSKTANIPKDYPFEDFKELYINAWKRGLNGFTTYREGSMESVMSDIKKAEKSKEIIARDIKLPSNFSNGPTKVIKREGAKYYLNFSYLPEDTEMKFPVCLWIQTNQNEKGTAIVCNTASRNLAKLALGKGIDSEIVETALQKAREDFPSNRLGRMISLNLRHNVQITDIYSTLRGIEGDHISTLLTAVRKFLSESLSDGTKLSGVKCPSCGSDNMQIDGGCPSCLDCGNANCG